VGVARGLLVPQAESANASPSHPPRLRYLSVT